MVLEGLVTTLGPAGEPHLAPMGPEVHEGPGDWSSFVLKPFRTAHTHANLARHPEGVLHVTDDVLLLARAAVGRLALPPLRPAEVVRGVVLADCCRWYEFRIVEREEGERARLRAEVVHVGRGRDFFGFNRGKHAVVEAAILATRTAFLPLDEIEARFGELAVLVDKTGGVAEREAFAFLRDFLNEERQRRMSG